MNILELIKAALKKANIDEKHAERIQKLFNIEKEEGIDAFVALFKDNVLPALQEAEKAAETQAIAVATAKAIEEYEKKHELKDGKPLNPKKEESPIDDKTMSPEIKALIEAQQKNIQELTDLVTGVVKKGDMAAKLEEVKAMLKGKIDDKYIERYAQRVNLEAEDMDAEIEIHVSDFNDMKQSLIAEHVGENYNYKGGKAPEKSVDEWTSLMDREGKGEDAGVIDLGLK